MSIANAENRRDIGDVLHLLLKSNLLQDKVLHLLNESIVEENRQQKVSNLFSIPDSQRYTATSSTVNTFCRYVNRMLGHFKDVVFCDIIEFIVMLCKESRIEYLKFTIHAFIIAATHSLHSQNNVLLMHFTGI